MPQIKTLPEDYKVLIDLEFARFKELIAKYAKNEPTKDYYNFYDGWHRSVCWQTDQGLVEFRCYRSGSELNAYKDDDSEWFEIDEGRKCSCVMRFGVRTDLPNQITEKYIKQGFDWLYN